MTDNILPFLCEASSHPESHVNPIELHHFGRAIKVAGARTFSDWTCTIINDEDFKIRNAMETWANFINGNETNVRKFPTSLHAEYKSTALVTQFSQTSRELRTYKMVGIFPTVVNPIQLAWDSDTVQRFDVTFAYDYWLIDSGTTGNAGGL